MALQKRNFRSDPTTGFGSRGNNAGGRFYRKDGTVNVVRKGVRFFDQLSWYHTMLSIPRWQFWLELCGIYVVINLIFAFIYWLIGVEHLVGVDQGNELGEFAEAFFFSAQTFTTVGYGRISPAGFLTSAVAAFEAFLGVLSFALASGLFYGRFAMPKANLYFSDIALFAPFNNAKAFMFRVVPYKNTNLTDAEVKLTLALRVPQENGDIKNEFYPLEVEFSKINVLALNWTIVHAINEQSPFYGLTLRQLRDVKAEVLIFLKAYEEVFATTVVARTSYTVDEFINNAKFKPMYHSSLSGKATVLHVDMLNDFELLSPSVERSNLDEPVST